MKECQYRLKRIIKEFEVCHDALVAIGDETRQLIIMTLLESDCNGIRVGEITEKTHLSRPAVSHHLKILKEAGMINMRREGKLKIIIIIWMRMKLNGGRLPNL